MYVLDYLRSSIWIQNRCVEILVYQDIFFEEICIYINLYIKVFFDNVNEFLLQFYINI